MTEHDEMVAEIEQLRAQVALTAEHAYVLHEAMKAHEAGRCYSCDWPLRESRETGCVPFNCSMRPTERRSEFTQWSIRQTRLHEALRWLRDPAAYWAAMTAAPTAREAAK